MVFDKIILDKVSDSPKNSLIQISYVGVAFL
jgi:hypothetical protein